MDKKALRAHIRALKRNMTAEEIEMKSKNLSEQFYKTRYY